MVWDVIGAKMLGRREGLDLISLAVVLACSLMLVSPSSGQRWRNPRGLLPWLPGHRSSICDEARRSC
jgi:hypothetical protein